MRIKLAAFLRKIDSKRLLSAKNCGFSLIELSIVIAVASSLMIGYLSLVQPEQTLKSNTSLTTLERMRGIADAIEAFRVKYSRLPCPADPLTRSDKSNYTGSAIADFGAERLDLDGTHGGNGGIDCPVQVGSVPFRSLGIKPEMMYDGWGRRFSYHVSPNLCGVGSAGQANQGCTPYSYANNIGDLIVNDGTADITTTGAFILVSHGPNGLGGRLPSGAQTPDTGSVDEQENSDADKVYKQLAPRADFDDIVMYRSKDSVDALATDVIRHIVSEEDCINNSLALAKINKTKAQQLDADVATFDNVDITEYSGSRAAITIMWALQDECYHTYDADVGGTGVDWETFVGDKKCPGQDTNGATYGNHLCNCPSGDWNAC